jgi:hypothetical protein
MNPDSENKNQNKKYIIRLRENNDNNKEQVE